jgi:hypothetical protein
MPAAAVIEPFVGFDDARQLVVFDLLVGQRQPFPAELAADDLFEDAAGVVLNVITSEVEIAEVANAVTYLEPRADIGVEEATDLALVAAMRPR